MAAILSFPRFCYFMTHPTAPDWYRSRGYLHFDAPLGVKKAQSYVTDQAKVSAHAFFPLIKYTISTEKVRLDKSINKLVRATKDRSIAYAAHLDSHILSYYAGQLAALYEAEIVASGLSDSIIAFRPLGLSNIQFAARAFSDIASRHACTAIGLDITGFFDNLDHAILKEKWEQLLGQARLPADHYAVFRSITGYSTVERTPLYAALGISEHNPKASRMRACSAAEFRSKVRAAGLVTQNQNSFGIPQGTPISALLSNIYMLDFDKQIQALISKIGGSYYRYCDDILVIVPTKDANHIAGDVRVRIKQLELDINPKKTEIREFVRTGKLLTANQPLQYLGFTFDGQRILIRSAALARYSQRMKQGVQLAKLTANSRNKTRAALGLKSKSLFKCKLYEKYSHLGKRNFVRYGYRAADLLQSQAIRDQLEPLWHRLVAEIAKP